MPAGWSGNLWGRTLCTTDSNGLFSCVTGDCGSGTIECTNSGAPPVTIANITLDGASSLDYYGVSLVNGFNVPLVVIPANRIATCIGAGCSVDINAECPTVLQDIANGGETVACKSGCVAFGDPKDCCTGAYSTNTTCGPTQYSKFFKSVCPLTNTYAFDNGTFTCTESPDYTIGFCEL
ncbi:hypothetical protein Vadar_002283 [Vaccinium darrowii]|uniref:Uncharacterized protein n=1 Tax=Vaccinium darrowii TaxID=229202 RepID=A0ACB7YCC6_9ERIC|nr:hypothetical protein Vadar_002283 [Vaccinium darrowii]